MKRSEMILLQYVLERSYKDKEALAVLNQYDAARTGRDIRDVEFINEAIRTGDRTMIRHAIELNKILESEYETK